MSKLKLNPSVSLRVHKECLDVIFSADTGVLSNKASKVSLKPNTDLSILMRLSKGQAVQHYNECQYDTQTQAIFLLMESKGWLVEEKTHDFVRQSKQIRWLSGKAPKPINIQEKISQTRLLIIGLGGLGLPIIEQLIGLGFKHYVLVDNDKVNEHNFNRQIMFRSREVGSPKVDIVESYINDRCADAVIRKECRFINETGDILKLIEDFSIDFVINCADKPCFLIEQFVVEASIESKLPCLLGGVGYNFCSYGPLLTSLKAKENYVRYNKLMLDEIKDYYLEVPDASIVTTNYLTATFMMDLLVQFFCIHQEEAKEHLEVRRVFNINDHTSQITWSNDKS